MLQDEGQKKMFNWELSKKYFENKRENNWQEDLWLDFSSIMHTAVLRMHAHILCETTSKHPQLQCNSQQPLYENTWA